MKKIFYTLLFTIFSTILFAQEPIKDITDSDFKSEIKEGIVLVDFWATWCMPCIAQGRELKKLAFTEREYLKIVKLDVDKNPKMSQRFYIESLPTLLIFKDGKLKKRLVGYRTEAELVEELAKLKD